MQVQSNICNRTENNDNLQFVCRETIVLLGYDMIYLLTAIGLTPAGSSTYTFTHKQYIKQNKETEYPERNIHNNKNT